MLRKFLKKKIAIFMAAVLFFGASVPASALTRHLDKITDFAEKINEVGETADTITIMFAGDLMCQRLQQQKAFDGQTYDFTSSFKYVKNIFDKADYVVGNLETMVSENFPLVKDMTYVQRRASLNAPSEYLDALEYAGFDGLVLANNHCCDLGKQGILDTIEVLDEKGFDHTGLFTSPEDQRYILADVEGFKIGILSYAKYFNNKEHFLTEEERSYMLNPIDEATVIADVKALREAGAQYIIAYSHCGTEYSQGPSLRQKNYAQMYADAGVDYVVGSHPHVLQRAGEVYSGWRRVPVLFSMGNFLSSMGSAEDATKETIVLSITLRKTINGGLKFKEHTYYPCYIMDEYEGGTFVVMPEDKKYNGGYEPDELVKNAFENIRKIIGTKYF